MKFPKFQFKPLVLPLDTTEKSPSPSSLYPPSGTYRHRLDPPPPEPSPLEDEQLQLSASPRATASCQHLGFSPCKMLKTGVLAPLCSRGLQGYKGRRGLLRPRSPPVLWRGSGSHRCTELAGARPVERPAGHCLSARRR